MRKILLTSLLALLSSPALAEGFGTNPRLPPPEPTLVPTVNIAKAVGWPDGKTPIAAKGLSVNALANGLDHPRWIYVLPNNDVLIAESNRPPKEDKGLKEWVIEQVQSRAGSGAQSANRITLLRDADGDGAAELKTPFIENLYSPFGMALVGNTLYVANANSIVKFPYEDGQTKITAAPEKLTDLPAGINHHWTKNIIADKDGTKLYASVGSNSNIGENGMDAEKNRAAILEVDIKTGAKRVFASGLRNPVGMDWDPVTRKLWTAVNERDELGDNLVPDYMTSVKDGGFYGWPYSYFGQNIDERVPQIRPDLVERTIEPDYALGPHTASLGLAFYTHDLMPQFKNGVLVGQHGSWNRTEHSGYKLVFVPFKRGKPVGLPQDVLTGFLNDKGEAHGRPVGVAIDKKGAILMADDTGNVIWRVVPAK